MGILCDYFRSRDETAAVEVIRHLDGGPVVRHGEEPVVDAVDVKGVEPAVTLGMLVASALSVPWSPELVGDRLVWPEDGGGEEYQGPWVSELSDNTRDALADIADERMSELAADWARIEEWVGEPDPEDLVEVIRELSGLSRRAREAGEHLYCWMSL